jgi:chromosome segregation ATPase
VRIPIDPRKFLRALLSGNRLAEQIDAEINRSLDQANLASVEELTTLRTELEHVSHALTALSKRLTEVTAQSKAFQAEQAAARADSLVTGWTSRVKVMESFHDTIQPTLDHIARSFDTASAGVVTMREKSRVLDKASDEAAKTGHQADAEANTLRARIGTMADALDSFASTIEAESNKPKPKPKPKAEKVCKVEGCTRPHRARGYCARHYQQWRRGTLEAT